MFKIKPDCRYNIYLVSIIGLFVIFSSLFYFYVQSEKELEAMNKKRLLSHELSDELRQSTDDMTRMVHSYVMTSNPIYKEKFYEIIDIRNGKKVRHTRDHNLYIDILEGKKADPVAEGNAQSLLDLIQKSGFTDEEMQQLKEAKKRSDLLSLREINAMKLIEASPGSALNQQKAIDLVFSSEYDRSKADIMRPILKAHKLMIKRTNDMIEHASLILRMVRMSLIVCGIVLLIAVARAYQLLLRINKELEDSKKDAQVAESIKADFMANMSHEIRTPLNGIVGFVHLLSKTALNGDQNRYLSVIQSSIDSLLVIVNDILDFSKIAEGKKELEYIEIKAVNEFEKAFAIFEARAKDKQISYRVLLDSALAQCIVIDLLHTKQVMLNLISNALKFTPDKGEVTIRVEVRKETPDVQVLRFSVRDSGAGIAKEKMGSIFDKFTQADISTTRQYGGSGLGLSISKSLVHMMGGELKVESEEGKGSCFYFDLEVNKCIMAPKVVNSLAREISDLDIFTAPGLRVLVAEDQDTNQYLISEYLKKYRIKADFANNGQEAVGLAMQNEYDLILMDINMPVMDGIEATHIIRENHPTIVIVALTAHVLEGDYEKFMEAGMNEYLTKPIKVPALEAILRHVYEQKSTV